MNKNFLASLKQGFADIKFVITDGKYKIFLRPAVFALLVCFAVYYYGESTLEQINKDSAEIASLKAQKEKMSGYTNNKNAVTEMEKFFPGLADKNEWLVTQIIENFDSNGLRYTFTGSQTEEDNAYLLVTSMGVTYKTYYSNAVKLMMDFENAKTYTKVQELSFVKDERDIGNSMFTLRVSTAFPKEKIGGAKAAPAKGGKK